MATEIPIPAVSAQIPINEAVTLTGLSAQTRYAFKVSCTKGAKILLQDGTDVPLATGYLFNQTYYIVATAATLTLTVSSLEGATATLDMAVEAIPQPVALPALGTPCQPNLWYAKTGLVAGEVYEIKVSSDTPTTVFTKAGASPDTAIGNPVFVTQQGSFIYTQSGTNLYLYIDSASPAQVDVQVAHPVVGMIAPQTLQLTANAGDLKLSGPAPAGFYAVDFVTNAQTDATTYNGDLTVATPANTIFAEVMGYTSADSGFVSIADQQGTFIGNSLRGKLIVAVDAPLADGVSVDIASIGAPTTGTSANFNGSAVLTFAGPLADANL